MNGDDATAYDKLLNFRAEATEFQQTQLVNTAVQNVARSHNDSLRLVFTYTQTPTEETALADLNNADPSVRHQALSFLSRNPKLPLSKIVDMATRYASLNNRCEAARIFNDRVKSNCACLNNFGIQQYWAANKRQVRIAA